MFSSLFKWKFYALAGVAGAALGYAYWYFIGCYAGTCPITSSPLNSAIYGAVMGLLVLNIFAKEKRDSHEKNHKKTD
jgi:hypothetical protein